MARVGYALNRRVNILKEVPGGINMDAQDEQNRLGEKKGDRRWLLGEVSWQEFWKTLDQLVDWNKKRDEIDTLRGSDGEEKLQR